MAAHQRNRFVTDAIFLKHCFDGGPVLRIDPGDDEVLIGRQAESTALDAGNVPQTIHQLAYKTAILNEQREVMTTIRCLRPTIAIAIGFEVERPGPLRMA